MKMAIAILLLILSFTTARAESPVIGQLTPRGTSNSANWDKYLFLITKPPAKNTNAAGKRVLTWDLPATLLTAQGVHVANGTLSVVEDKSTSYTISTKNNSEHARHFQTWAISAFVPPDNPRFPKYVGFGCATFSLKPRTGGTLADLPSVVKLAYTDEQLANGDAMSWASIFDQYWNGKGENYLLMTLDVMRTEQPRAPFNCQPIAKDPRYRS